MDTADGVAVLTGTHDLATVPIRLVTTAPGTFDTASSGTLPDDVRASLGVRVPHPSRLGRPVGSGAAVVHVVADPVLDGDIIRLDGGIRTAPR